jgi:hypothetical protein
VDKLLLLADLIKRRNEIEKEITSIINRPALIGHLGEFICSQIFNVPLVKSASNKGIDGHFSEGELSGCSVNIKWYIRNQGLLDITPSYLPDYYLVLTGLKTAVLSSVGISCPWAIESVYLFNAKELVEILKERGIKIGVATSVINALWEAAEIYPRCNNISLTITPKQIEMLSLFK